MTRIVDTPVAKIEVPADRLRELQDYSELAESMSRVGLLQPITVNEAGTLVAGRHRLEAARSLGWETISAVVVEEDDLLNRLAEIDENLQRFDLTVYEQAKHAEERERVLKALGQRATPKNNQHAPATVAGAKTTADVAKEVGMSERSWQQRVKIGEAFGPETRSALDMADLTDEKQRNFLNSTKQLDTLANISNKRGDETAAKAAIRVLGGDESNIYDAYPEIKKEPKETPDLPSFELPEERREDPKMGELMERAGVSMEDAPRRSEEEKALYPTWKAVLHVADPMTEKIAGAISEAKQFGELKADAKTARDRLSALISNLEDKETRRLYVVGEDKNEVG